MNLIIVSKVGVFIRLSCLVRSLLVQDQQTKLRLLWHLHLISSGTNNTECPIHHLASSCIPSPREATPWSPDEESPSVSLVDSEWQNTRVSIVLESILSPKGQSASNKLNISCDTWATHKSGVMIEIQEGRILAYDEGINEALSADN